MFVLSFWIALSCLCLTEMIILKWLLLNADFELWFIDCYRLMDRWYCIYIYIYIGTNGLSIIGNKQKISGFDYICKVSRVDKAPSLKTGVASNPHIITSSQPV